MSFSLLLGVAQFVVGFVLIWYGSGLIITSVDKISHKLKVSSFIVSFFLLGMLTSIPEISLGLTALSEGTPSIFIGNLIGGILVLFFLVIPVFAIVGNGIKLTNKLESTTLLYSFVVFLSPLVALLDKTITSTEAVFMLVMYAFLVFTIQKQEGLLSNGKEMFHLKRYSLSDMLKVLLGVALVFTASYMIVNQTLFFAELFNISPFIIGILILSIGTNLPEISLAFRAIKNKKKDIAFGDYLGSASANIFVLCLLILLSGGNVEASNGFINTLIIAILGFGLFYHFTKSKHDISRKEGMILLIVYVVFVMVEGIQIL